MIEQARFWWAGRSPRERVLLGVLGALVGLLFFWLAIVRPIDAARTSAEARLDIAAQDSGRIAAVARAVKGARQSAPPALSGPLPDIVGKAAEAVGLTLSRLDAQGSERVTIAIASARSPAFFGWLGMLERQGILVERMTLRPGSDGTIAVEGVLRVRGR